MTIFEPHERSESIVHAGNLLKLYLYPVKYIAGFLFEKILK